MGKHELIEFELGQVWGPRDRESRYRIQVIALDPMLVQAGKRGIQVQNVNTGRRHWTSRRAMLQFRLIAVRRLVTPPTIQGEIGDDLG